LISRLQWCDPTAGWLDRNIEIERQFLCRIQVPSVYLLIGWLQHHIENESRITPGFNECLGRTANFIGDTDGFQDRVPKSFKGSR
jgi:hypothetical protein